MVDTRAGKSKRRHDDLGLNENLNRDNTMGDKEILQFLNIPARVYNPINTTDWRKNYMLKAVKHRLGAKKLRGAPYKGLSVRAVFPSAFAGMTVKMEVQASANDSTYNTIATYPGGTSNAWAPAAGDEVMLPFALTNATPYVKLKFTITGNTTTGTGYGAVQAGLVVGGHGNWTREVRWD